MVKLNRYIAAMAGMLLALCFASIAPTTAQESPATPVVDEGPSKAFEFYPAETGWGTFFAPVIEAGSSAELTATTANVGDVTQEFRLFRLNAFTADGGGFASGDYADAPNDVTTWIELDERVETVEPRTGIETSFTVSVPDGTAPGEYLAAVAAEQAESSEVEGTDNLTQTLRYVVPVMITVPGPTTTDFSVGDISITRDGSVLVIQIPIINSGDVRVRPEGTIELQNNGGDLLATVPVAMESVYARDKTTLTVGVTAPPTAPGPFQVHVDLADPASDVAVTVDESGIEVEVMEDAGESAILITSATVTPGPAPDNVQFATIEAVISNAGDPVANAQLSLIASLDGEEIERFPISQALSLQSGDTAIETRYIPITGWTSGDWTFELLLETVDSNGAAVVVARQQLAGAITIP